MPEREWRRALLKKGVAGLLSEAFSLAVKWAWAWVPASVWASMTAWLASAASLPSYQIALVSSFAFMAVAIAGYHLRKGWLEFRLTEKLLYERMEVCHFFVHDGKAIIQLRMSFKNCSYDQMWFRIDRVSVVIGHQANPYAKAPDVGFAGSHCSRPILLPAVSDVPSGVPLNGRIEMDISYGRNRDNMKRKLNLTLDGKLMIHMVAGKVDPALTMNWMEQHVEYR